MSLTKTILIVEDEPDLRRGLRDNLELEGYKVLEVATASAASGFWLAGAPDLVLLDIMLPGKDGFRLLSEMRAVGRETPVIILTARGEVWDRVKGFRLGCDDYVVKPFNLMELVARVAAVLKRTSDTAPAYQQKEIVIGDLKLDLAEQQLFTPTGVRQLSGREFELMAYLMNNFRRTVPRKELLREVWHSNEQVLTRTIDVHMARLRRELNCSGYSIETVYKVGYRLIEEFAPLA